MSTAFELDQSGWDKRVADARLSNFDANEDLDATKGEGIFSGLGQGIMRGGAKAADTLATIGKLFDEPGMSEGDQQEADRISGMADDIQDNIRKDSIDFWTPSSREVGVIGRTLGGFGEIVLPLAASGGNPSLLIGSAGIQGGKDLVNQGVDATTAVASGEIDALATAVGFKQPFLGKTLARKVLTGGAGNVLLGGGSTELQKELLSGRGYDEMAKNYDPLDVQSRAIDLLTGMAFGGIDWASVRSETRAAAAAANNAKHYQQDTAPGIPQDHAAIAAHAQAMDTAFEQMIRGEPVSVDPAVMDANFKERPAPDYSADEQAIREIIGELPQPHADVPHEVVRPVEVPHGELEKLPVDTSIKQSLREVYEKAAEVKPKFDAGVRDIAKEIGTSHEPLLAPLKGVARAAEKVVADYGGDARQIKDVVRATVLVDDVIQANAAIKAAIEKFGEPTKQRNTLDSKVETTDGYRDVNLNFKINGHTVELQVNVPEMVEAKLAAEGLYHERRTLEAKAGSEPSPELTVRIAALDGQMKARYAAAWNDFLSRSKSDLDTSKPSSRAQESVTGRPSGTSNARTLAPPADVGSAATGTPPTFQKTGSLPRTGIAESSTGIIRAGDFESPVITELKEQLKQQDVMVATGEVDTEGNAVVKSGRQVLAEAEARIAKAEHDSQAFEAAVTCFLTKGEE